MEDIARPKKKHKAFKIVLNCVVWTIIGLVVLISAVNIIDRASKYNFPFFGLRASVVVSESMSRDYDPKEPIQNYEIGHIQKNDVVITTSFIKYEDLKIGDVVTYYSERKGLICHRVINLYSENNINYLITKGDANSVSDGPIKFDLVKGKVFTVLAGVGTFISFIQSGYMLVALLISAGIVLLVIFVYRVSEDKKKAKEEKLNENTK